MGANEVINEAVTHLGCPYVYGTWGQLCTPALRKRYARYNPSQEKVTYSRCQVLRDKNPQPSCDGCKYKGKLAFDCRGFTHYCVEHGADIDITGGYVGRQWSDPNWDVKGNVSSMLEAVSCVFLEDMSHTGLYILHGDVIHCSGEVKYDTLTGGRKWAKFAIPKGLYTWQELSDMLTIKVNKMLKKGMTGPEVMALQIRLNALGYDCGTADSSFGKKTEEAVKRFQEKNGLKVDGIAGPETLKLLGLWEDEPQQPVEDIAGVLVRRESLERFKVGLMEIRNQLDLMINEVGDML